MAAGHRLRRGGRRRRRAGDSPHARPSQPAPAAQSSRRVRRDVPTAADRLRRRRRLWGDVGCLYLLIDVTTVPPGALTRRPTRPIILTPASPNRRHPPLATRTPDPCRRHADPPTNAGLDEKQHSDHPTSGFRIEAQGPLCSRRRREPPSARARGHRGTRRSAGGGSAMDAPTAPARPGSCSAERPATGRDRLARRTQKPELWRTAQRFRRRNIGHGERPACVLCGPGPQ